MSFWSLFVLFCFFLLAIVLSVLLGYTNSVCPFGIFKLFTLTFACMLFLTMWFFLCFNFVTMLLMSVLKTHKSLCYYATFIHVPTISKAMNLNLKADIIVTCYHLIECNWFSPYYGCKIANLASSNNHWLIHSWRIKYIYNSTKYWQFGDYVTWQLTMLFVRGLMSYLRNLCLFAHSGVKHTLCCICLRPVSCVTYVIDKFFWIVHIGLHLRYSLTFIIHTLFRKSPTWRTNRRKLWKDLSDIIISHASLMFWRFPEILQSPSIFPFVIIILIHRSKSGKLTILTMK